MSSRQGMRMKEQLLMFVGELLIMKIGETNKIKVGGKYYYYKRISEEEFTKPFP